tara:strand:- start:1058 stop:1369 length:312 start_codon:yes stop_codon:yes gene_type:complete
MIKTFSTGLPLFLLYIGSPSLAAMMYLGSIFESQILEINIELKSKKELIPALAPLYFGSLCTLTFMMPVAPLVYLFTFSSGLYISHLESEALNSFCAPKRYRF